MNLDATLEFADNTALPTSVGTAVVGNVIDYNGPSRVGDGNQIWLQIQVTESVASSGSATVEFLLSTGATDSLGTDVISTTAIEKADLEVKRQITLPLPAGYNYDRYIGLRAKVSGSALTSGKINAFIQIRQPDNWYAAKDSVN